MKKQHSHLSIEIDQHDPLSPETTTTVMIEGCRSCLIKSLTQTLLKNEQFKLIINSAVRAANEIRAKTQN